MDTNTLLGSAAIAAIISGIFSYVVLSKKGNFNISQKIAKSGEKR